MPAFFTWANSQILSQNYRSIALTVYAKNNLTLFHHQGLTLENTLFPDSVLGTQLPEFHLHLFYIKTFDELSDPK
jgi:hypothetical protein